MARVGPAALATEGLSNSRIRERFPSRISNVVLVFLPWLVAAAEDVMALGEIGQGCSPKFPTLGTVRLARS